MKNKSLNEVLSELAKNWKTLDEIEKEYIALRLLNDNSADFMYLINVICAAVEFVDDMDSAAKHCTSDIVVKDRNEYGKSDLLGVPDNDYLDHIKARREQIYREIRDLSGNNIPAQLKALQEQLRDNCEAMKAVLEG